jgi:hypothetical protein
LVQVCLGAISRSQTVILNGVLAGSSINAAPHPTLSRTSILPLPTACRGEETVWGLLFHSSPFTLHPSARSGQANATANPRKRSGKLLGMCTRHVLQLARQHLVDRRLVPAGPATATCPADTAEPWPAAPPAANDVVSGRPTPTVPSPRQAVRSGRIDFRGEGRVRGSVTREKARVFHRSKTTRLFWPFPS